MPDLNALFLTVGNYCRREVITCTPSFRLHTQVDAMSAGRQPDNRIRLTELNRMEQVRLKGALEGVRSFQGDMGRRYRLGQTI